MDRPQSAVGGTLEADRDVHGLRVTGPALELRTAGAEPAQRPPDRADARDIYTREQLLSLQQVATSPLDRPVRGLLSRLGILRGARRRGVRAGRKSSRRIPVRVTARVDTAQIGTAAEATAVTAPHRWLTVPPRLTLRQTRRADEGRAVGTSPLLKIGHLNVRSLTRHLDDINHLLMSQQLDILCLSESWLTESMDSSMLLFPGYSIIRRDRQGRTGGGVAILHRNELTVEPLTVPRAGSSL